MRLHLWPEFLGEVDEKDDPSDEKLRKRMSRTSENFARGRAEFPLVQFRDRAEAGRILAEKLRHYANNQNAVVLALPRGGVPVAYHVAQALRLPLDVFVVRKLGLPGHEELAIGAIASGGVRVLNEEILSLIPNAERIVAEVTAREVQELQRREALYRGERSPVELRHKIVILVDDGAATGATMKAAVKALREHAVAKIVTAVPVGAPETCYELSRLADESICAIEPQWFRAVGQFFRDFSPTTDQEVRELLARGQNELKQVEPGMPDQAGAAYLRGRAKSCPR